jgi:hypothetical protein
MALTQGARGKIKSFVQDAKKLLLKEFEGQLQQHYGIRMDGSCLMVEVLTTKDATVIQTARLLRERLDYLEDSIAGANKKKEAVQQLVREQAFTILNRFAALRMAEERSIIRESIRKDYKSEGFEVFDQLTGGAKTAEQFIRYTWYIKAVFDELAIDLPAVFDRFSPYALLFPSERTFLKLLSIINQEELHIFREEGKPPINLWKDDETIGWIYQYYNSKEEIKEMRDASDAPRNSRELAVRNQFFTPRYVVQFLVDNSLGRQWYEMTKGNTRLSSFCQYMVKRPYEVFLKKGEQTPENKNENTHYIEYRILKDPREILMLDPACGSMHFGLYSFDLYEQIYIEAWDNYPELMMDLRDKYYDRNDFIKQIPSMIIRYNLHGVDIDPRAIQIAGLSLWLRAQKSYDNLKLQPAERPAINKSNLVVAEPMPGDAQMVSDFTKTLPGPIGKLVRVIWDKMKLAGETGLLLKIEEELIKEIEIAKQEWEEYKNTSAQTTLFDTPKESKVAEMAVIYGKGQKITKDFFDTAEEQVLKALQKFAENAEGENAFQKLLFAEDTARGFAFIEMCRKRYDVILQNPPFGSPSVNSKSFLIAEYPLTKDNLASIFVNRCCILSKPSGYIGSITTRSPFYLGSFENWRKKELISKKMVNYFADFGSDVLDATVETAAYVLTNSQSKISTFIDLTMKKKKDDYLLKSINGKNKESVFNIDVQIFTIFPNTPFCYWVDESTIDLFKNSDKFEKNGRTVRKGICTSDNFRYTRLNWEILAKNIGSKREHTNNNKYWVGFINTENSIRFVYEPSQFMNWKNDGIEVKAMQSQMHGNYSKRINSESSYFKTGLSWAFRTSTFEPHIIPKGAMCTSGRFLADFDENEDEILFTCGIWNSIYYDYIIKLGLEASSGNPKFINGVINQIPHPEFKEPFKAKIIDLVKELRDLIMSTISLYSNSILYSNNTPFKTKNLSDFVEEFMAELLNKKLRYKSQLESLNKEVFNYFEIDSLNQTTIIESVRRLTMGEEGSNFNIDRATIINQIFNTIICIAFGNFDARLVKTFNNLWLDDDIIKPRTGSPFLYEMRELTLDLVLPDYHHKINEIWRIPYPIQALEACCTVSENFSITSKLEEVIHYFWPETTDTIIYELQEHFKVDKLDDIFNNPNKFFEAHLKDYSRNKRISPIFWHLSIPSGKFTVWIYYPKLNSNSLYKIVNELVDPKIKDVMKEVSVFETKGSSKDLNDAKQFRDELEDFKKELLRVAQLPYKPNQDDGVLITAAPMHNLFRHTKWRKSTEECWKQLERGDFDWSHLAYSIWPERVRKKCKKDLSMAIAHGLEDICEIKPKEKTEKKKPEIKVVQQIKLM